MHLAITLISGMKPFVRSGFVKRAESLFFQAADGIRDDKVTGVQTCALPIWKERVDRDEDTSPKEGLHDPQRLHRVLTEVSNREASLRCFHEVVLRIGSEPLGGSRPQLFRLANAFCAATAMGSLSAPIGGEYTF